MTRHDLRQVHHIWLERSQVTAHSLGDEVDVGDLPAGLRVSESHSSLFESDGKPALVGAAPYLVSCCMLLC